MRDFAGNGGRGNTDRFQPVAGSTLNRSFFADPFQRPWQSSEPNDRDSEDCVEVRGSENFEWNDVDCSDSNLPLCRVEVILEDVDDDDGDELGNKVKDDKNIDASVFLLIVLSILVFALGVALFTFWHKKKLLSRINHLEFRPPE